MYTAKEVIEFVKTNDVKFIRLSFCDLFGTHKNIAIMPDELERAFKTGISFDASSVKGFTDAYQSDLFLFPDPSTLRLLPWRGSGRGRVIRFYCDIKNPNGEPYAADTRRLLKTAVKRADELGYRFKIGAECEFYLFKTDENGSPTEQTHDEGGYFDIAPLDKGENVRRDICLTLEEMGINPETSHHEQGPGQNEIDFKYGDVLDTADNILTLKAVVKAIAAKNGLFASFMPKPLTDKSGNGMHINLSLLKNGVNLFDHAQENHSAEAESFIAGVLTRAAEMTAFLNPLTNSYARLGHLGAPKYVSWSHQNRSQLIRIPAAEGEASRMELRSPDPAINPYLAFSLLIHAGLDGIENRITLPPPVNINLFTAEDSVLQMLEQLPENLADALMRAKNSEFVCRVVEPGILDKYLALKSAEAAAFTQAADPAAYERANYFKIL